MLFRSLGVAVVLDSKIGLVGDEIVAIGLEAAGTMNRRLGGDGVLRGVAEIDVLVRVERMESVIGVVVGLSVEDQGKDDEDVATTLF